jgi:primase-polymerase (primpol)-like protein
MNGGESNNTSRNKESDGNFGGWDVMQWNLERALRELFEWTQALKSSYSADSKESSIENERTEVMEKAVLMKTRSKSMSSTQAHDNLYLHKRRSRSGSRSSFLGLNSLTESMTRLVSLEDSLKTTGSFFEPLLYRIQYIRRRLGQTTDRYARMVYAHEMLHIIDDRHLREEDDKYLMQTSKGKELEGDGEANWMDDGVSMVSELSKFLNLMSSGLYMCNYVSFQYH